MKAEFLHIDNYLSAVNPENTGAQDIGLWVNSDQIGWHQVQLPDAPKAKWMSLLPWILEDELLLPVEELHLVICSVSADRVADVLSIPKREMHRLQLLLESSQACIKALIPDLLALPLEPGFVTLAVWGERLLVRSGDFKGFSGTAEFVWQLLEIERSQEQLTQIQCFGLSPDALPEWAKSICRLNPNELNWSFSEAPAEANLLSGAYRPRSTGFKVGRWWPSLSLAAVALILFCSWALVNYLKSGSELELINQQLVAEFEAGFAATAAQPAVIKSQASEIIRQREFRYLGMNNSVVGTLSALDSALSSCSGCEISSVKIVPEQAVLVIKANDGLAAKLSQLAHYHLVTGAPDAQQRLVMTLRRTTP